MTFSLTLLKPLVRTVKVDFCLLLRETMPSQRADVWAKANMEGRRTSIAASNKAMRCFTMESAPLIVRDFLFKLKSGKYCTPVFPFARLARTRLAIEGVGDRWLVSRFRQQPEVDVHDEFQRSAQGWG